MPTLWSNLKNLPYKRFFKLERLLNLLIAALVISYASVLVTTLLGEPKLTKYQKEFNELADKYMAGKNVSYIDTNELRIIFNSINRKSDGALLKYGYISTLEDYLVHITTDNDKKNDKFYRSIFTALENEKKQEPYSNLPTEERRILVNLDASIRIHDAQTALSNLSSLNDVLRMSNEHREKIEKQNRWAIPFSIVGVILTILFGIISIFRPLQLKRISTASRKGSN